MGLETVRKRNCGGVDTLQAEYFAATLAKEMGMHVTERMMLATAQLILEAPAAVIYGMHNVFLEKGGQHTEHTRFVHCPEYVHHVRQTHRPVLAFKRAVNQQSVCRRLYILAYE
jgi:hypothetical protein